MCAATAAAVGTAVAAVAAVGTQVAGAVSGPSGGGGGAAGGAPKIKDIPGFGPATGLQSYTARLLAANKDVRTPGIMDWAASGGTLRPDWKVPELTPKEAGQLGFVDKTTGKPIPGYDTEAGGRLSPEATAYAGQEKTKNLKVAGFKGEDVTINPQQRYGQIAAREEMLQSKLASGANVANKLAKVQTKKAKAGQKIGL